MDFTFYFGSLTNCKQNGSKKAQDQVNFLLDGLIWFLKVIQVWNLLKTIQTLILCEKNPLFIIILWSKIIWRRSFDDYFWHGFCRSILQQTIISEVLEHGSQIRIIHIQVKLHFDKKKKEIVIIFLLHFDWHKRLWFHGILTDIRHEFMISWEKKIKSNKFQVLK